MKKKKYQQPEVKVVKLEQTEIICTSGITINNGEGIQIEEENWAKEIDLLEDDL